VIKRTMPIETYRPGRSLAISAHLCPTSDQAMAMISSSRVDQGSFLISGLRWLCHLHFVAHNSVMNKFNKATSSPIFVTSGSCKRNLKSERAPLNTRRQTFNSHEPLSALFSNAARKLVGDQTPLLCTVHGNKSDNFGILLHQARKRVWQCLETPADNCHTYEAYVVLDGSPRESKDP
jgi:hypothetical protein